VASLRDTLLTILGDIKIFRWPMFAVYDPGSYRVKGRDTREVLDLIKPGDVLVRGYEMYLDGKFIPGYFSHAGLYLGELKEEDAAQVKEGSRRRFRTGKQLVIHAIAEGVLLEDLIDFCRCDRLLVLRFPEALRARPGVPPDPGAPLDAAEAALRDRLLAGGEVRFEEAWPVVRRVALEQLGRGYDFSFDFTDVRRLSCTELVHRATRALAPWLGVQPRLRKILFLSGTGIAPDDLVASPLELVWRSPSGSKRKVDALRGQGTQVVQPTLAESTVK
jgi:hypothetical protein